MKLSDIKLQMNTEHLEIFKCIKLYDVFPKNIYIFFT